MSSPNDTQNELHIIGMMPSFSEGYSPEIDIINAARTSFLGKASNPGRDKRLLTYLYNHEHSSPFEMSEFVLKVSADSKSWLNLTSDPRIHAPVIMSGKTDSIGATGATGAAYTTGMVRFDVNNALKYLQYNAEQHDDPISAAVRLVFHRHYPWINEIASVSDESSASKIFYPVSLEYPRVSVLGNGDKFWIELQSVQGSDEALAQIAKFYFGSSFSDNGTEQLIRAMFENGDLRPMAMQSIKVGVRFPVVTMWQWARHRWCSFSLQSGRYMPFEEGDVYRPAEWRRQSTDNKQGSSGVMPEYRSNELSHQFDKVFTLSQAYYTSALHDGVAKEQARFFLPAWTSAYQAVIKMDLMALMRFLRLRMAPDAQYEIRVYAQEMFELWKKEMPLTAEIAQEHKFTGA